MRKHLISTLSLIPFFTGFLFFHATAQESSPSKSPPPDLRQLQQQIQALQKGMDQMRTQHQEEIAALKAQVEAQKALIARSQNDSSALDKGAEGEKKTMDAASPIFPTTDPSVLAESSADAGTAGGGASTFPTTDASVMAGSGADASFTGPITVAGGGGGGNYLNISFNGQFTGAYSTDRELDLLEVGDHDPQQSGFNARNLELVFDGAVDPYFEGFVNLVFKLDNENETGVEAEEAFLQTTSLPWNLQLKGGQFFSPFGRVNPTHPHTWDFVDTPLVQGRFLGPDGLRGVGAQASWLAPLPWYSSLIASVQNGNGGTAYSFRNPGEDGTFSGRQTIGHLLRTPGDLVFVPRWENSYDLSPTQTILGGVSAALGHNDTGPYSRTEMLGVDLFYKWKPTNAAGGWPFLKWQTEAMLRRFEAGRGLDDSFPEREVFDDWGVYSQLVWGFKQNWTAGVRGDYLHMEESPITDILERESRERFTADLTYYPTEFSKLRLQYNYDILEGNDFLQPDSEHSVFFQFEFGLGAHSAHKF